MADFVILNCEIDVEVPIILGRLFFVTRRALVEVQCSDIYIVSTIDWIDESVASVSEVFCVGECRYLVVVSRWSAPPSHKRHINP